ncbi:MAG: ATP-grasp domain-containing protein [Candidatus Paceibacterota bacterium]
MDISGEKNIILVAGIPTTYALEAYQTYCKKEKKKFRFLLLHDKDKKKLSAVEEKLEYFDFIEKVDFGSVKSVGKVVNKYQGYLKAAIAGGGESNVVRYSKVVPFVTYLNVPTASSLKCATDKLLMRRRLKAFDKNITPVYSLLRKNTEKKVSRAIKKIGFPMIIKPVNLSMSLLVDIAYYKEELTDTLGRIFRKINKQYKDANRSEKPQVILEEFMEGKEYSVDCYVDNKGEVYFCPLVGVKRAFDIGVDDFFHYRRFVPTKLNGGSREEAKEAAKKAVHAIGLKNSTAHVEMMKTEDGWKIVEIGSRLGGYRHKMYEYSFGINHALNDFLIKLGKKPRIPKKVRGYTAVFEIFADKEGRIESLRGIQKAPKLKSVIDFDVKMKVGDKARFAKRGGKRVIQVTMFNKDRSKLLADIRRMEKMINIKIKNGKK